MCPYVRVRLRMFRLSEWKRKMFTSCTTSETRVEQLLISKFSVASIAQWQSVGLVNQRSWVQSSLEAVTLLWSETFPFKKKPKILTPTWFEHAAFWSGVRRATVAPRSQVSIGSTEIWTRIAGFRVQSANHYTIRPYIMARVKYKLHSKVFTQCLLKRLIDGASV